MFHVTYKVRLHVTRLQVILVVEGHLCLYFHFVKYYGTMIRIYKIFDDL